MTKQSADSQILTWTGTIPGEPGVGGVILRDLIDALPPGTLRCVPAVTQHVIESGWLNHADDLAGHVLRRYETGWRPLHGVLGEVIGLGARRLKYGPHCRSIIDEVCSMPHMAECDRIWAIMDCPTVIETTIQICEKLKKPLYVLVWDDPALLSANLHMDRWSAGQLTRRFAEVLQRAERVAVICQQMADFYGREYGISNCVVLRHGTDPALWKTHTPQSDRVVIGFAGSITARQPFLALIAALDKVKWRLNDKPVTLRLIGSRYTLDSRQPQHIEYYGWRNLSDTIKLLSECTFAYLPQPFDPALRRLAELSFPTKLTTYLAAACPTFLHAPKYGSVVPFLQQHAIGQVSHSLEPDTLAEQLQQFCHAITEDTMTAIAAVRESEFSRSTFIHRFCQLMGLSSRTQLPKATAALATDKIC